MDKQSKHELIAMAGNVVKDVDVSRMQKKFAFAATASAAKYSEGDISQVSDVCSENSMVMIAKFFVDSFLWFEPVNRPLNMALFRYQKYFCCCSSADFASMLPVATRQLLTF